MDTIRNGFQRIPPSCPVQTGALAMTFDPRSFPLLLARPYPRTITTRNTLR